MDINEVVDKVLQGKEHPFESYFQQINDEFNLTSTRLKRLIKNRVALGAENEVILREFLKNYIPKHYSVGHGFILNSSDEIINQCDIIIYDSSFFSPLFKQGDFVVLQPEAVMSVIEVKTKIKPGKSFLSSAIDNIRSARKLNSRISGIIFAYGGSYPVTILNDIAEYYKDNKPNLKEVFELMVNLDRGYCIVPKGLDDGQVLFNFDVAVKNTDTAFVLDPLATEKRSFYLFFYYILRQIRSYIFNSFIATGKVSPLKNEFSFIPALPHGGLHWKSYFDTHKDKITKLLGESKFDDKGDYLGVLLS